MLVQRGTNRLPDLGTPHIAGLRAFVTSARAAKNDWNCLLMLKIRNSSFPFAASTRTEKECDINCCTIHGNVDTKYLARRKAMQLLRHFE